MGGTTIDFVERSAAIIGPDNKVMADDPRETRDWIGAKKNAVVHEAPTLSDRIMTREVPQ
jgi:hypothetical protein